MAALLPVRADAQQQQEASIFAPYVGVTTGGQTTATGTTYGFSTAYVAGSSWGAEFDLAHSTKFNEDYQSSGLTTVVINLMVGPQITPRLRLYGVAGGGLIRARGCLVSDCVREFSVTDFGWDAGGGAYVLVNDFVGARADVRYFRYGAVKEELPRQGEGAFDFWRISFGGFLQW